MKDRSTLVLDALLRALKPAARLLLQNGVSYGAFATAMKRVFLAAAQDELKARGMAQTDSAITLLSGVHRRDVRTLLRGPAAEAGPSGPALSLASEIVLCWLGNRRWLDKSGKPRALGRGADGDTFDALVATVSTDVRPRAVLDELVRLGVAEEDDSSVRLLVNNFVPRKGLAEMAVFFADNLHDHIAAASMNLHANRDLLEQSVHVDRITAESAEALHKAAKAAWKQTFDSYFALAQQHFDGDADKVAHGERAYRARLGMYFLIDEDSDGTP